MRQEAASGVQEKAKQGAEARRRVRAVLSKQEKRPGIGRCQANHQRWPNASFATHGLFTLRLAYEQARHSR